jgi:hypothetical protein
MRASELHVYGSVPILLIAPRMIALYAHTVLNCYATTDYINYRDFSFAVSRYVVFRLNGGSNEIRVTADSDTCVFEAGVSIPEIETLDALFKEIKRLEGEIGVCGCGKRIRWSDPVYEDATRRAIISTPGTNRRMLSSCCLDCLTKQNEGDVFCPSTA